MNRETRGRVIRTWTTQDGTRQAVIGLDGRGDRINAIIPRGVEVSEGDNIALVESVGRYIVKR